MRQYLEDKWITLSYYFEDFNLRLRHEYERDPFAFKAGLVIICILLFGIIWLSSIAYNRFLPSSNPLSQHSSVPFTPIDPETQDSTRAFDDTASVQELHPVISITDGDTIIVSINGEAETIRIIGLNTPETKDPRKPVECFGQEATKQTEHYVGSKKVILESDPSQDSRDKYGRLLRHVILDDGTNVALQMIKEGYAYEYTYNIPYKYQQEFKTAEKFAKESALGLWSPTACNGQTDVSTTPTTSASAPTPRTQPAPNSSVLTYFPNCSAARAVGAAPVYVGDAGYGSHLDRDSDGIGCE